MATSLLRRLIKRGDKVYVDRGRLVIVAVSGKPVPDAWLVAQRDQLMREIAQAINEPVLKYLSYSTGVFDGRYDGVSLQFINIQSGENPYAIFNADLRRQRNGKHGGRGSLRRKGQFRVGERSSFYRFWLSTALTPPKSLSSWHDCMGKLKPIFFMGTLGKNGRFESSTLRPATITHEEIFVGLQTNKGSANAQYIPEIYPITRPDKKIAENDKYQIVNGISGTGQMSYGNKVIRIDGYRVTPTAKKPPQLQSTEEWLAEYDEAESL